MGHKVDKFIWIIYYILQLRCLRYVRLKRGRYSNLRAKTRLRPKTCLPKAILVKKWKEFENSENVFVSTNHNKFEMRLVYFVKATRRPVIPVHAESFEGGELYFQHKLCITFINCGKPSPLAIPFFYLTLCLKELILVLWGRRLACAGFWGCLLLAPRRRPVP